MLFVPPLNKEQVLKPQSMVLMNFVQTLTDGETVPSRQVEIAFLYYHMAHLACVHRSISASHLQTSRQGCTLRPQPRAYNLELLSFISIFI